MTAVKGIRDKRFVIIELFSLNNAPAHYTELFETVSFNLGHREIFILNIVTTKAHT